MTPRQQRMLTVGLLLGGVTLAVVLGTNARRSDLLFFVDPTELAAGNFPKEQSFNLGGMVRDGSWQRAPGSLETTFVLTDFKNDVAVSYTGVLPDLFREGQGVVATGRVHTDGKFVANKILAKHDENYMPPNVAESLQKRKAEMAEEGGTQP